MEKFCTKIAHLTPHHKGTLSLVFEVYTVTSRSLN